MTALWEAAAVALTIALGATVLLTLVGSVSRRIVGLQAATVLLPLTLVAVAMAADRSLYLDAAIGVVVLSLPASIAYARFVERWL